MIKEIVLASAKNCLFLMKYYAKNKEELKNQISDMESVIQEIILSKEGELLLLEARMKKIY